MSHNPGRGLGQMIHYVCKYTPVELLNAFGESVLYLEEMPENFEMSDQIAHANAVRLWEICDSRQFWKERSSSLYL